jgi:hypothetical protein
MRKKYRRDILMSGRLIARELQTFDFCKVKQGKRLKNES